MEEKPLKIKKHYSLYIIHSFTPNTFHREDLFPITTTINSTTISLLSVNDSQDLMSIKFR